MCPTGLRGGPERRSRRPRDTDTAGPHLLREAQDRVLGAEGIPLLLAPPPAAAALDDVRSALLPGHRPGDLGATTAVLQATSCADFGRVLDASARLRA